MVVANERLQPPPEADMPIQTCEVICKLIDQSGEPIDGARIAARLMVMSAGSGLLQMPDLEYSVTNARGECTLILSPSSLGGSSSTYTFEVQIPGGRPRFFKGIHVPEVASVTLDELLGWAAQYRPPGSIQIDGETLLVDGSPVILS